MKIIDFPKHNPFERKLLDLVNNAVNHIGTIKKFEQIYQTRNGVYVQFALNKTKYVAVIVNTCENGYELIHFEEGEIWEAIDRQYVNI